jgi:DHA1 family inner membrane transport protein
MFIMGGVLATYSYITPLLTERAGVPEGAVPVGLIAFGLGALAGTTTGGRLGDRRPMATTLTAAAATALVLLLLIPLSANPLTATVLVFLMGLTGFTVNPVVTALAMRFAGDAPTLTSALSTSAFNTGIAAGSAIAGTALESSLGPTGPPLVGAGIAVLTLLPLTALAVLGTATPARVVGQRTSAAERTGEPARSPAHR